MTKRKKLTVDRFIGKADELEIVKAPAKAKAAAAQPRPRRTRRKP